MRARVSVLAVVIALAISGCHRRTPHPTPVITSSTAAAYVFDPSAVPSLPTAHACPYAYTDIQLVPQNAEEKWLAPTIRACERLHASSTGTLTYSVDVINAGPAVWLIDNFAGWNATSLQTSDPAVTLFRYATQDTYSGLALEPGQDAFSDMAAYWDLQLDPNVALQAEWETISRLTAAAESRARAAVLGRLTPAGQAVMKCGVAGFQVGQTIGSFNETTTGTDVLTGLYQGAGAVHSCSEALDVASAADRQAGESSTVSLADLTVRSEADVEVEKSGLTLIAAKLENALGLVLDVVRK